MACIFEIAIENGQNAIVLSAFGSGAYGCPPKHMAQLWKEVLKDYSCHFIQICFGIIDDTNSFRDHNPDGNLTPYRQVFKN